MKQAPAVASAEAIQSIFHQPWWLDIATDRSWGEAIVRESGTVAGRLPYMVGSRYGMPVSTLPSLVCSLGPVIRPLPGKASTAFRRRLEITHALIDQLPPVAYFEQTFDPCVTDAAAFVYRGFVAGAADCFRIPAGTVMQDVWCGMQAGLRQTVVDAGNEFRIEPIDDGEEFLALDPAIGRKQAKRLGELLQAIGEHDAGSVLGARRRNGVLAAGILLVRDSMAAYRLISARRASESDAVESLLVWEACGHALPRGLAFDLGPIASSASLRFLAGFGDYVCPRVSVHRVTSDYRLRKALFSLLGRRAS